MSNDIAQILHEIAASTLEEMCFMFEEPDLDEDQFHLRGGKAALIKFKGAFSGTMILKASGRILQAFGENMLGEDELTEGQMQDALGEVSNVICGNVLPEISGSKKDVFDLESPIIYRLDELPEINAELPIESVRLPLEEGFIEIQLIRDVPVQVS
ncbi:chemotaxis protein CheX [candidate division KSB1 bacterium]|nr:chemotaxis protein CheX [candidate division KSB1 bacterium]